MLLALSLIAVGCAGDDDDSAADDDDVVDDDSADDDSADGPTDTDSDGYLSETDCDDEDAAVHPGAEQVCDDNDDNDCDGIIDDNEADRDADGHSECDGDCNENNAAIFPGAVQTCFDDVLDNDCDSIIDANETDGDSDGFTDCEGDCDDADATVHPDAFDVVDGDDNDCDGTTDEDVIDCDLVPVAPISQVQIPGARGYHGLAIDEFGFIVGSDGSALIKSDYQGNWTVYVPNIGYVEQITYLPDGDLAVADAGTNAILRIDPNGYQSYLGPAHSAYGLVLGPDEMLYTAGGSEIWRIDPTTGADTLVTSIPSTAHTVNFNGDATKMYIGTIGGGQLYVVELDENLDATGAPQVHAQFGGWHDGLGVDACEHVFVVDYSTSALYRISPDGVASMFVDWDSGNYGHGLIWGNGIGGWKWDALYVPLPYNNNRVNEVVVGVPPHQWGGTVYNLP